jgi:chromosome segregation ATPase
MAEQEQKIRSPFLDDFPAGILIIGAVLLVFVLDLLSGAKVIGVDQEKVAVKKEWVLLNKEKEDFYRKKKEWDKIDELLAAGSSKLETLKNKTKDENDRQDELKKENKTLDETSQKLKNDVSILEERKADTSKQESALVMSLNQSQQKLAEVMGQNQDLVDQNKKLEGRNGLIEQETLYSEDLKNSIKKFIAYVENLKTQTDKIVTVSSELDSKSQDSDQTVGTIQDNTSKLLTLSQSLQGALNNIISKIDDAKTINSNTNKPNDNTDLPS